jgi:hypothetical protein
MRLWLRNRFDGGSGRKGEIAHASVTGLGTVIVREVIGTDGIAMRTPVGRAIIVLHVVTTLARGLQLRQKCRTEVGGTTVIVDVTETTITGVIETATEDERSAVKRSITRAASIASAMRSTSDPPVVPHHLDPTATIQTVTAQMIGGKTVGMVIVEEMIMTAIMIEERTMGQGRQTHLDESAIGHHTTHGTARVQKPSSMQRT